MKCAYCQKQKRNRMTSKDRACLNEVVSDFMEKSIIMGPKKALELMEKEQIDIKETDSHED